MNLSEDLVAVRRPVWSPDGTWLAVTRFGNEADPSGRTEIELIRSEGSERRRLNSGEWTVAPSWSPDGRRLAAWARPSEAAGFSTVVFDTATGSLGTSPVRGRSALPLWAPTPGMIAYARLRPIGDQENSADLAIGNVNEADPRVLVLPERADRFLLPLALESRAGRCLPTASSQSGRALVSWSR